MGLGILVLRASCSLHPGIQEFVRPYITAQQEAFLPRVLHDLSHSAELVSFCHGRAEDNHPQGSLGPSGRGPRALWDRTCAGSFSSGATASEAPSVTSGRRPGCSPTRCSSRTPNGATSSSSPFPTSGADHAFDAAVKGVSAIAHVASVVTFESDPHEVIPRTVAGAVSIMEAALREPSVKEFVYTSSIVATTMPCRATPRTSSGTRGTTRPWSSPGRRRRATIPCAASSSTWPARSRPRRPCGKFVDEKKPHFNVNSVNPGSILGYPLHKKHAESPVAWVKMLWDGGSNSRLTQMPAGKSPRRRACG